MQKSKQLTPEERAERAIRARKRFKAAVRLALVNSYWLEDFSSAQLGDNVTKNIRLLTQKTKKPSTFTLEQKSIMMTPKEKRTEEEKKSLHRAIGGLICFRRYPNSVKQQLAEVTYFSYIPPKRTIIRQNDEAKALFFLVSGEVTVYITDFDKVLDEWVTTPVGNKQSGSMFGEVSLLHGVKRMATVITSDHCEVLLLFKADFEAVLKATVMAEWAEIEKCMALFSYFANWDSITARDCCIVSKVKSFSEDDIILGEDVGDKKHVYFIVEGQCELIEYFEMQVTKSGCKYSYKLLKQHRKRKSTVISQEIGQYAPIGKEMSAISHLTSRPSTANSGSALPTAGIGKSQRIMDEMKYMKTEFVRVATFNRLATFNLGENLSRRYMVATKKTKVLMIPRYWLLTKNKEIWTRIKQFLNSRIPDTAGVFQDFLQQKKWQEYKRELVKDIMANSKKVNLNNIHNVPYSIRIKQDMSVYYCDILNKVRM